MKRTHICIALLLAVGSAPVWSNPLPKNYSVDLSGLGYGHIDQNTPGITNGGVACGPTATANSFWYLQTRYGINGLGPSNGNGGFTNIQGADNSQSAINTVNAIGTAMGLTAGGVTDPNFIAGKQNYLSARGLLNSVITVEYQSVAVGGTTPTWQFLYDQLNKGQDVEVGFNWSTGGGHWVTATGFTFNDANGNNTIDAGETATLNFIDPWGGSYITGNLSMNGNNLQLNYSGGAAGNGSDPDNQGASSSGTIDIVVAESPVPEPASLVLLALGSPVLLLRRKR